MRTRHLGLWRRRRDQSLPIRKETVHGFAPVCSQFQATGHDIDLKALIEPAFNALSPYPEVRA